MKAKNWAVATVVTLAFSGSLVAVAAPAEATVSKSYCHGKSYKRVVKRYTRGSSKYPMRCGSLSWGFRHLAERKPVRWNHHFDSMIALTIAKGEIVQDLQQDGGSKIIALMDNDCHELFRVIYNENAYHGHTDVRPQGLITAFEAGVPSAVVDPDDALGRSAPGAAIVMSLSIGGGRSSATTRASLYRQNCEIDQRI